MKPSIRIIATSLFAIITTTTNAQNLLVASAPVAKNMVTSSFISDDESSTILISAETLAASNPKLIWNFTQIFPTTTNVVWSKLDNNYFVSFEKDGQPSSAVFTNKGALNYTITNCSMEQLPASLKHKMSEKYNGYNLFHASQIVSNGTESYSVVMENTTGFVTLLHSENETEETRRVDKPTVK